MTSTAAAPLGLRVADKATTAFGAIVANVTIGTDRHIGRSLGTERLLKSGHIDPDGPRRISRVAPSKTRPWVVVLLFGVLAGALALGAARQFGWYSSQASAPRAAPPAVPVHAAVVKRQDVPIVLPGLGTVQAFNSVLVKSRVDGQIIKINFTEGQNVRAGDVLVEIDPAPFEAALAQTQATKLKDEAQLENARLDLERFNRLATTNAVSKQQIDTARALVAQIEATVKADQAMIDMAQTQLNYTRIRSPIDGRAGSRVIDAGNFVRGANDTAGIVTINQLNPINVTFALPADTLPRIKTSTQNGDVPVVAQDSNGNDLLSGKLTVIDNLINPATATINYKATFDNSDEVLWPGQFVNVRVELAVRRDVVAIPLTAVQQGPDGPYAFVVGENRRVQKRALKVGVLTKTVAIIDDGLQQGDVVVTEGQYRIQPGTVVDVLSDTAKPLG
jgi:membrane fusion protein, multidrug efflux system